MKWSAVIRFLTLVSIVFYAGCSGSRSTYTYRVVTDSCNCGEYTTVDRHDNIEYRFRAGFRMDRGIVTTIEITFVNRSRDTLFLDPGVVRISSRNISYRYNNKFIPLPGLIIPPFHTDNVVMTGSDVNQEDDWNKIAGELLMVTLKSIRLGKKTLPEKTVAFVPINPKLANSP